MIGAMELRSHLILLLVYVMYPMWLVVGAVDYLCHRRTRISHTSGVTESSLHVLQFVSLALPLGLALFLQVNALVFTLICGFILAHTILAYVDVRYTLGLRHISALEQQVHGLMDTLPLMALALVGALNWESIRQGFAGAGLQLQQDKLAWPQFAFMLSFLVLSGVPILEEWLRTRRAAHMGLATIK